MFVFVTNMSCFAFLLTIIAIFYSANCSTSRKKELEAKFNLTNARKGRGAVDAALDFLVAQEQLMTHIEDAFGVDRHSVQKYKDKVASGSNGLPVCRATFHAIVQDGLFIYEGDDAKPLYDDCWARRARYHTAPLCEAHEIKKNIKPIYKWKWMLQPALQNLCRMPDTDILQAAKSFLAHQAKTAIGHRSTDKLPPSLSKYQDPPGKAVNILMLGLSFMGQPFTSLVCLNNKHVDKNSSYVDITHLPHGNTPRLRVDDITKDNGHCTGYAPNRIMDWYPSTLHPANYPFPHQNIQYECAMDYSYMVFRNANSGTPTVRVCYIYSFDLANTVKDGSELPCDWKWADIDVIFALHDYKELSDYYFPRKRANLESLTHLKVVNVNPIYEGYLFNKLKQAYKYNNFTSFEKEHYQAKPKDCVNPDCHYRMPGITDYAAQMWMSLLATGLHESDHGECKPEHKLCHGNKYFGTKVKYWGFNGKPHWDIYDKKT